LLKTEIGWKENYDGVLFSTRPLSSEITTDYNGREEVNIPGLDPKPVIKRAVSPQFFVVFFDLG
jgi:hypothetical protein